MALVRDWKRRHGSNPTGGQDRVSLCVGVLGKGGRALSTVLCGEVRKGGEGTRRREKERTTWQPESKLVVVAGHGHDGPACSDER